jgi:ATP-dependent RNA helicase SUPV3L1/SUV3
VIKIIYFFSKPQLQEKKEGEVTSAGVELGYITTSQALQIAGRAGRFKTQFPDGYVTTLKKSDLPILRHILKQPLERIKKAGLLPTEEQIELFAHNLPNQSLGALIEIFMSICKIESSDYFLCEFENVKALAVLIDHIPMQLKTKYKFCLSPINVNETLITSCFVKFARYYSNNEPVTAEALKKFIGYPLQTPRKIDEVRHLEVVYDVFDLYLWLSTRYVDMFPYAKEVTQMRKELEDMIYTGVKDLSKLNSGGMKPANRNIPHRNDPSPLNNSSESRHGRGSTTDEPSRGKSANSKNKSVVEGQQSRE